MFTILNKENIESMITQSYYESNRTNNHDPLIVTKLSVIANKSLGVDGGCYAEDDFFNKDYAYDCNLALVLDCYNLDSFHIMPAITRISENPDFIMFEWIPNKPVFVTSKYDYMKLYESFVEYLEKTQSFFEDESGFSFMDMDFSLCFKNLFEDTYFQESETISDDCINVLFTEEHFKPERPTIHTLNGIF